MDEELPAKTQSMGALCGCPFCRGTRATDDMRGALSALLEQATELEGRYYYLRDVVENVLEDIEGEYADEDWFKRLAGGVMATDD